MGSMQGPGSGAGREVGEALRCNCGRLGTMLQPVVMNTWKVLVARAVGASSILKEGPT